MARNRPITQPVPDIFQTPQRTSPKKRTVKLAVADQVRELVRDDLASHQAAEDDLAYAGHLGLDLAPAVILELLDGALDDDLTQTGVGL